MVSSMLLCLILGQNPGRQIYVDRNGTKLGSSFTDRQGHTIYYGPYGRRMGASSTWESGHVQRRVYSDPSGSTMARSSTARGRTQYYDRWGRKNGTSLDGYSSRVYNQPDKPKVYTPQQRWLGQD